MDYARIVTDSTADVPAEIAEELQISVVPAYVQFGERSYRDGIELSREAFFDRLPDMEEIPTTAVPPVDEWVDTYRDLVGKAERVIAITLSATLSGMHDVAQVAAREVPELDIQVVDSRQVTMGHGLQVIAAAEAARDGKDGDDILRMLSDMRSRVHVFALLDTLSYVRRGGRVGWAQAMVAQILNIKPILEVIEGAVDNIGRVRTRKQGLEKLIEIVQSHTPLERLSVIHTVAPEAEHLRERLAELTAPDRIISTVVNTVIGAHVGPKGLGVALVTAR